MGSKASPAVTEGARKTSESQQLVICSDTESALRALSRSSEPWVTAGSHSSGAVGCSASLILNSCSELGGGRQRHPQVLWAPTALPQGLRGCGDSTVLHTQPPPALLLPNDQQEPEEGGEEVWLCRRGAHHPDKTHAPGHWYSRIPRNLVSYFSSFVMKYSSVVPHHVHHFRSRISHPYLRAKFLYEYHPPWPLPTAPRATPVPCFMPPGAGRTPGHLGGSPAAPRGAGPPAAPAATWSSSPSRSPAAC